jgi:transcription elongation factor GreA
VYSAGANQEIAALSTDHPIVLTPDGYDRIEKELERLKTVDRHEVADRIRESKQFGEFSENAEYEEAKNEQAFVEGRIDDLRRILANAHVLNPKEIRTDVIGIGSRVTVHDIEEDEDWEFTLVGSVESDPGADRISDESPVGRALLGKKVGEVVSVAVPDGTIQYKVVKIRK